MERLVDLTGRRILVTGSSSGIGRATAVLLAKLGASVVLAARRETELRETLKLMPGEGHLVCACDLGDGAAVLALAERAGRLSGLVHAAGCCPRGLVGTLSAGERETAMRVGYTAFLELMGHYSKQRNREADFAAVAVSSVSASAGWAAGAAYCGAKGALSAAVRALAVELAPKGVRVNAVSPANIRTPMLAAIVEESGEDESRLAARQPLGIGAPEDVAAAIAFLVSPAAKFVTGVDLPVDGGYLAQ